MKLYNYSKIKEIIDNSADTLETAALGMHEDWFWTVENVWENGKYTQELTDDTLIGGIKGSIWATPTLQLIFKDGEEQMLEVSTGENTHSGEGRNWANGCLSGPVQKRITPITKRVV